MAQQAPEGNHMEFSKTKMISMVVGWLVLLASGSVFAEPPCPRERRRAKPYFFNR